MFIVNLIVSSTIKSWLIAIIAKVINVKKDMVENCLSNAYIYPEKY